MGLDSKLPPLRCFARASLVLAALWLGAVLASCDSPAVERAVEATPQPAGQDEPAATITLPATDVRPELQQPTEPTQPAAPAEPGLATQQVISIPTPASQEPVAHPTTSPVPAEDGIAPDTPSTSTPPDAAGTVVEIKFREGVDVQAPQKALPPEVRDAVDTISPLSTLSPEALQKLGADSFNLWFRITLQPGVDPLAFLEACRRSPNVESAELAPSAAPPP